MVKTYRKGGCLTGEANKRTNNINTHNIIDYFGKKRIREIITKPFPPILELTILDLFKFILAILITIAVCLFIFNEVIDWRLKQELLMHPCELCNKIMYESYIKPINFTNVTILS